jgi:hypothetical protein
MTKKKMYYVAYNISKNMICAICMQNKNMNITELRIYHISKYAPKFFKTIALVVE